MSNSRWPVLEIRDFRLLLLTRFCSAMALTIQAVIVGWQIYTLKPDPLLLGLVGLVEAIPAITCAFVSGHIVDVHRPAIVFRMALVVLFLNAVLLWSAISPYFPLSAELRLVLLFTAVFISGAARSFTNPAVFKLTPQIVPRSQLGAASAWNSSAFQIAAIAGPALGGLMYAYFGPLIAFALPMLFQLFAVLFSTRFTSVLTQFKSDQVREPFVKSVRAGLAFAFGHRVLISTMALDMFSVLFGGAVAVLPIYADQVLHVGATGLGFLRAAPSVGSVFIALWIAFFPMKVISGRLLLIVIAGFGLATLGFALSTNFVLSLVFLALTGAFDGVNMVIRGTITQLLTPDHMRGRVSSVASVFITSSNEIGAFESGVAARAMGLVPSVVFGGVMTLIVVGGMAWKVPELWKTRISQDAP